MVPALTCNAIRHVKSRCNRFSYLQQVVRRRTEFLCSLFEAVNRSYILGSLLLEYVNTSVQFCEPEPLNNRLILFSFCKFLAEACNCASVRAVQNVMAKEHKQSVNRSYGGFLVINWGF